MALEDLQYENPTYVFNYIAPIQSADVDAYVADIEHIDRAFDSGKSIDLDQLKSELDFVVVDKMGSITIACPIERGGCSTGF